MISNIVATSAVLAAKKRASSPLAHVSAGRSRALVERAFLALRTTNALVFFSGLIEPIFFLFAFGFGVGELVGNQGDVSYAAYIAPALLANSAMSGAIADATWNVFFKMHFDKLYHGMLATSLGPLDVALGEISWAMLRAASYAVGFLVVCAGFGIVGSWWALLAIPCAVLVGFGFAALGMAATSYMTSLQQVQWTNFILLPMFLFSGSFYSIEVYPEWLQSLIQILPLWHANELIRDAMSGNFHVSTAGHILYFLVFSILGIWFTTKRLTALFLR